MEVLNGVVHSSISYKLNNTHVRKSPVFMNLTSKLQSFCKIGVDNGDNCDESRNLGVKAVNLGFENKGHLEYYEETNKGKKGWSKVSTKKKMKLLKGLSKDLNTFSEIGFGLSFDDGIHGDDDKGMTISKAAEVLLAQLKQLKLEEDKQKKKEKQDKKKKCKNDMDSSSSSSSSESSDSECGEVVDLKRLRDVSRAQPIVTKDTLSTDVVALPTMSSISPLKESINEQISLNSDQSCCNMILETSLNKDTTIEALSSSKRIEVCMGGKCKKSGAPALMEEFQKAVGDEGVVVGCKCMGKCKTAPNVKLSNDVVGGSFGDDSMRTPSNPLYIGVGLEDVELIASSYFGSGQSVAAVAS